MKKGRMSKFAWFGLMTVLLMALLLPITAVMAEIPGDSSVVEIDAGYALGDTYQRHSWYSDGRHWVFWSTDSQILYTSSADLLTWETPALFSNYSCTLPAESCCNGSVFSLWYDDSLDRVDIAYSNVSDYNTAIYYKRGRPETDGTIAWGNAYAALNASANVSYSHPSVCTNTEDYPYIAVMAYNLSSVEYEGWLTTSATKTGVWTPATNSTANISLMTNTSNGIYYPSVIPVSAGNVSVQYALIQSDFIMGQNYADYDIVADTWDYGTAQYPLPATSTLINTEIWRHSEVAFASINNSDDVYMVCKGNDSVIGTGLFYDRYGDSGTPWSSDDYIEEADIIATLSVRNALGNLVLTAVNTSDLANIYSADYTQASLSWNTITSVRPTNAQAAYIMSSYDNSNSSYVDYLWLDNGAPFDLALGCYGCTVSPSPTPSTDPGTTVMQIIIPLLVAITVVVVALKGIGEVNTVNAIVILMVATLIGVITFFVIKQLVLGI